ncbi:MAG: thymidylate kinase [Dehalococcoidia bacterium]|nr:thymidylate kinase [Dehalococcoidia bacterium]
MALATEIASSGLIPDLWVLLDVDARAGLGRKRDTLGLDRFENEEEAFYTKVREGYLKIAAEDPERWLIIDGALPAGRVEKFVLEKVKILLTTGNK